MSSTYNSGVQLVDLLIVDSPKQGHNTIGYNNSPSEDGTSTGFDKSIFPHCVHNALVISGSRNDSYVHEQDKKRTVKLNPVMYVHMLCKVKTIQI